MPNIKKNGIKNIICLTSSYKCTFLKIKIKGIKIEVNNIVPKKILFFLFMNIFFSVNGIKNIPSSIIIGNLTDNHIGI